MTQSFTIFDEAFYLSTNPDVASAVRSGAFRSGFEHFQLSGLNEGRVSISPLYDEAAYLNAYPDVSDVVRSGGFRSGLQHFVNSGFGEGRTINSTFFDEQFYLRDNPDVAGVVRLGAFRSGLDHFIQSGQREGRSGTSFDSGIYLATYPDVAEAVRVGAFKSSLEHWISSGQFEADRFAVFTGTSRLQRELAYYLSLLQGFALVSPLEGLSHSAVEVINEFMDTGFQLSFADEIGTSEEFTHQDTEPHLNLIEPRTMLGGEVKHNLMTGITQEVGSILHGFENT